MHCPHYPHIHTTDTELYESVPDDVVLEHFEMNTNGTNTIEIATTENVAYMTTEDAIPTTQNVAYGQVPPGADDCYDYIYDYTNETSNVVTAGCKESEAGYTSK